MSTRPLFLPVLRELARTFQAFEAYSALHIRTIGLTTPQFDIIATLGNTEGMSCKQLGEKTLITKGTLTGVIDRLIEKQLVNRQLSKADGRSQIIQLTAQGQAVFEQIFPEHLAFMALPFNDYSADELAEMETILLRLRKAFNVAQGQKKLETWVA
ncbi:MAG: MarR family transcriptional regulator [Methylococcaceae bacterium]|jgi:DNA-binding MarR family transcriptional regulator